MLTDIENYKDTLFTSRKINADVAEERGYRSYGGERGLEPVFEADPRYADGPFRWAKPLWSGAPLDSSLRSWVERRTKGGTLTGWIMPKYALPGSVFDAPIAQLRPDVSSQSRPDSHSHADLSPKALEQHLAKPEKQAEHAEQGIVDGSDKKHTHKREAKYLLPPGPHGKRWDAHPRCDGAAFRGAERVFLHIEGVLKADSLISAGEVVADVPSVTLWDRHGAMSYLDFPLEPPEEPTLTGDGGSSSFWDAWEETQPELTAYYAALEKQRELQQTELEDFLREYVRSPIIIVCDRDWREKPLVALEALTLRDRVRKLTELPAVVAAPPRKSKGSDDYLARGGKVDNLLVIEPLPHDAPERPSFERDYRRNARGTRGKRRRSDVIDRELQLLDWYATMADASGVVQASVSGISRRIGISRANVRRYTKELAHAGALEIPRGYGEDREPRLVPWTHSHAGMDPRQQAVHLQSTRHQDVHAALSSWDEPHTHLRRPPARGGAPVITVREGLRARPWEPTVRRWLKEGTS